MGGSPVGVPELNRGERRDARRIPCGNTTADPAFDPAETPMTPLRMLGPAAAVLSALGAAAQETAWPPPQSEKAKQSPPGLLGPTGPRGEPQRVKSLHIDKKAVYEDYLVDAEFGEFDAVRIKADGVVLRNCEIRNGRRDAIEVYAADVLIENCRIHHFLNGSFKDQKDAHGITGRPTRLVIRNCEIYYCSGDSVQFDPGRGPWGEVLIENCVFWTGPLPEDAADFKKGEQPGENAVDTKQNPANARSRLWIRDCVCRGFAAGGQISNVAALNIKDHVAVGVERCVFYDNEIAVRVRGPGRYGGSHATIAECFFYRCDVGFRVEDKVESLKVRAPAFGAGVKRKFQNVAGGAKSPEIGDERPAPALEDVLKTRAAEGK
jgi:hypothetical protein